MFKDLPRIEQPRPDVTYGLWKADIDSPCRGILDTYHCELAKDVELPWFLVEVKTLNAVVGEAENQCIRGGAVLVNGHHQWNRVADGEKHSLDLSKKEKEEEHDRLIAKREKAGTVCILAPCSQVCVRWPRMFIYECLVDIRDRLTINYKVPRIPQRLPSLSPFPHQPQRCMCTGGRNGRTGWSTGTPTRYRPMRCGLSIGITNSSACI